MKGALLVHCVAKELHMMDNAPLQLVDVENNSTVGKVLHRGQVARQAGTYPCFCSMKRLGVFPPPSKMEC